ncbi:hypothetical protein ACVW0P_003005 [Mucilaginibacter sp. UYNi724]
MVQSAHINTFIHRGKTKYGQGKKTIELISSTKGSLIK